MNADRNSDESIVPSTSANNEAAEASAESSEGRDLTKRNVEQTDMLRTQGREHRMSFGLHGVREAARKDSQLRFTALLHHINEDCLREAFFNLTRNAAVGIDEVTWQEYERDREANIVDLHERLEKRRHRSIGETGRWLRRVVQGWLNYHAVPSISQRLCRFVDEVTRLWLSVIRKRSQRGRRGWTWERMQHLARLHLPRPRVPHPYPNKRFHARLKVGAV